MKRTLISLSVAFTVAVLIWLAIVTLTPKMNNEIALNIIVLSSIGAGILTAVVLRFRSRRS